MKAELKKTADVLKHLKKKVGGGYYDDEYQFIMEEINEVLQKKEKDKNI